MNPHEIRVHLRSIEGFRDRLEPQLQQVAAALSAVIHADGPALGTFHHARQTEQRYYRLHSEFVGRMRRLLTAMVVAQAGTRSIVERHRDDVELFQARLADIANALTHSNPIYRNAVLHDAGLDATLFQDAALYEATATVPATHAERSDEAAPATATATVTATATATGAPTVRGAAEGTTAVGSGQTSA